MLVLSRYAEESIIIGEGDRKISIKIIEVDGRKVRIGFEAPKDVVILRAELLDKSE